MEWQAEQVRNFCEIGQFEVRQWPVAPAVAVGAPEGAAVAVELAGPRGRVSGGERAAGGAHLGIAARRCTA
eukprot:6945423-Prymnesium_polylepis.1